MLLLCDGLCALDKHLILSPLAVIFLLCSTYRNHIRFRGFRISCLSGQLREDESICDFDHDSLRPKNSFCHES